MFERVKTKTRKLLCTSSSHLLHPKNDALAPSVGGILPLHPPLSKHKKEIEIRDQRGPIDHITFGDIRKIMQKDI